MIDVTYQEQRGLTDEQRNALADALYICMSEWSESNWCARWLVNVEYELWQQVERGAYPHLRVLAELSGYWNTFDGKIPLDEWKTKYAASHYAVLD